MPFTRRTSQIHDDAAGAEAWGSAVPDQGKSRSSAEHRAKSAGGDEPLPPDRPAPPVGGDTSEAKSFFEVVEKRGGGAVGFYNRFWLSQGSAYTEVGGQVRTSMIRRAAMGFLVIPSDGDIVYGD